MSDSQKMGLAMNLATTLACCTATLFGATVYVRAGWWGVAPFSVAVIGAGVAGLRVVPRIEVMERHANEFDRADEEFG